MPSQNSLGYTQINGHKHKPRHPLTLWAIEIIRDTLGVLILGICILVPVFLGYILQG